MINDLKFISINNKRSEINDLGIERKLFTF